MLIRLRDVALAMVPVPLPEPGTPVTLRQAIVNGVYAGLRRPWSFVQIIEKHVQDYLAQRFCTSMLESDERGSYSLSVLYWQTTGKKIGRHAER